MFIVGVEVRSKPGDFPIMEAKLTSKQFTGPFWPTVFFAFAAIFLAVAAFATGAVETFGYESKTRTYRNFSGTDSGYALGFKQFYYRAGQEFFAKYDADIKSGALNIRLIMSRIPIDQAPHFRETVLEGGQGEVRFRIQESGFYTAHFEGSVLGADPSTSGYDVSYTVTWGAR